MVYQSPVKQTINSRTEGDGGSGPHPASGYGQRQQLFLDENDLQNAKNVEEVVARSKAFELDTILFYEFLTGFLDDQEAIEQLRRIIEEERNHIMQLERIGDPKNCDSYESLSGR